MRCRTGLQTLVLFALLTPGSTFAQLATRIEPAVPTSCDDLELVISRFTSSDCNWSVRTHALAFFEARLELELNLVPGSEVCLPVALEETFRVPLGRFPAGEWQFSFSWTDGHPVDLRSISTTVVEGACDEGFHLADSNGDTRLDVADPVATLNFLFLGGELPCEAAADANSSETIELTDAVFTLAFLFQGGPGPIPSPVECTSVTPAAPLDCRRPSCGPALDDGTVWIAMPDGCLQCDECPNRTGEDVAIELRADGFTVLDATEGFIGVCEACSCPSGRYWILRVRADELAPLSERGWEIWGETQPFLG